MIVQGDNRETLKTLADNSIDAIVTDPPYGIDFLGKAWDANTGAIETYQECLRVLKPGGYILAFSAARTYHHLAVTLEQAGFEIRDQIMWLYSSGFPKAQDIGKAIDKRAGKGKDQTVRAEYNGGKHGPKSVDLSMQGTRCPVCERDSNARYSCDKGQECGMIYNAQTPEAQQWAGWKTALKPAHEPIAMARKPFKGSAIDNVLTHGVGALNIDATRIDTDDKIQSHYNRNGGAPEFKGEQKPAHEPIAMARKPFKGSCIDNVLENGVGALNIDESRISIPEDDETHATLSKYKHRLHKSDFGNETNGFGAGNLAGTEKEYYHNEGRFPSNVIGEVEDYQKYFYCPKVSRKERMEGNNHPTVKPVALMRYLIKLVTPPNSIVLDPFCGSGSTGMAAVELGHEFIGCELDPAYIEIAEARIAAWNTDGTTKKEFFK